MITKNILKIIAIFVIGTVGGIFADQLLWPYLIENSLLSEYRLEDRPVYLTEEIIIRENVAIVGAVEKVEKAVVGIRTQPKVGKAIEGSGLAVTSDGLVVSLAELVPQNEETSFFINGSNVSGRVLKRDLVKNLALIKIEQTGLPTVSFADFSETKRGQRVFLSGIVFMNKLPEKITDEGIVRRYDQEKIYTNIMSNFPGSSLFNVEGKFLGLNTVNKAGEIETISIKAIKEFAGL
ncbi:MAG: serine protease [bacterium]